MSLEQDLAWQILMMIPTEVNEQGERVVKLDPDYVPRKNIDLTNVCDSDGFFLPLPTQQYLNECFTYDPEYGYLRWNNRPEHHFPHYKDPKSVKMINTKRFGRRAGYLATCRCDLTDLIDEEYGVELDGKDYDLDRIIYCMLTGIDYRTLEDGHATLLHIDGDDLNTRIENLRIESFEEWSVKSKLRKMNYEASKMPPKPITEPVWVPPPVTRNSVVDWLDRVFGAYDHQPSRGGRPRTFKLFR